MNRRSLVSMALVIALVGLPVLPVADSAPSLPPSAGSDSLPWVENVGQSLPAARAPGSTPEAGQNLELIGQIGGLSHSVVAAGQYAYASAGPRVAVFDIANPGWPVLLSRSDVLPGLIQDVNAAGDYVYAAASDGGVQVVDVANPTQPHRVGGYKFPGEYAFGVAISGTYALVATYSGDAGGALHVVDVSDPTAPAPVGQASLPNAFRVAISGDYALVAMQGSGVAVVDVADPAHPAWVDSFSTQGNASDLILAGDYAYLADGALLVLDISDPLNISQIARVGSAHYLTSVTITGTLAYGGGLIGMVVLDITNPAAPLELGHVDVHGSVMSMLGMAAAGDYAYLGSDYAGLRVIDVHVTSNPQEIGGYTTPVMPVSIDVQGTRAVVTSQYEGVHVLDVTNPEPVELGAYRGLDDTLAAASAGQYAYVAIDYYGLAVLDISDPQNIALAALLAMPGAPHNRVDHIVVSGTHAYLDAGTAGLQVVDISNPISPTIVGSGGVVGTMAIAGTRLYAEGGPGMVIYDVTNPAAPAVIGTLPLTDTLHGLAVAGGYAYLAEGAAGLHIVDISNPAALVEVGVYAPPAGAYRVSAAEGYAYVSTATGYGLQVVDVTNPAYPFEVGYYDMPGPGMASMPAGPLVHVAAGDCGVITLRMRREGLRTWMPIMAFNR